MLSVGTRIGIGTATVIGRGRVQEISRRGRVLRCGGIVNGTRGNTGRGDPGVGRGLRLGGRGNVGDGKETREDNILLTLLLLLYL